MQSPTAIGVAGGGLAGAYYGLDQPSILGAAEGAFIGGAAGFVIPRMIGPTARLAGKGLKTAGQGLAWSVKGPYRGVVNQYTDAIGAGQFAAYMRRPDFQRQFGREVAGAYAESARNVAGKVQRGASGAFGIIERHPVMAGSLAVGGFLAYQGNQAFGGGPASTNSPTLEGARVNTSYSKQAMAAEQLMMSQIAPMGATGTTYQMMGPFQEKLQASTAGLVQGLHNGRH